MTTTQGEAPQSGQEAPEGAQAPATGQEAPKPQEGQQGASGDSTEVKKLRSEASNLRRRLKEQEDELAKLQEATQTEQERAITKAVREARKEWDSEHRADLLREKVKARAATKVSDPDDALALMDLTDLDPEDPDGIDAAVDALVEAKPYLAQGKAQGKPKPIHQGPQGTVESGPGKEQGDPNAWLRDLVNRP